MTSRLLFRLLPIQILLAAIGSVNAIVSSIFASNAVGVEAMSAVGLYTPVNRVIMALSTMLVSGSAILCGRYMGKNLRDEVNNTFSLSLTVAAALSVLIALAILIIGTFDLSGFLCTDTQVRPILNQYLIGQAIGIPAYLLGGLLSSYLSLENRTRVTTTASLTFILVNVLLNFVFLNVCHLEALGLALASSVGMWIFFCVQAWSFLTHRCSLHFSWRNLRWYDALTIVRIGVPGAANNAYKAIRSLVLNMLIMGYVGSVGLSAYSCVNALLGLAWAIPVGMLNVSRMLISVSVGEEDRETLVDTMRNAVWRFTPLMFAISLIITALAVPLTTIYFQDPAQPVFDMTVWGFRILPITLPLAILPMHLGTYGQALDRNLMVNLLQALDGCITVCVFSALLAPVFSLNGIYVASVINGLVSIAYLIGYSIICNYRVPQNMAELMVIPAGFGVANEDRLVRSLRSMDDVASLSDAVQVFCAKKGIDRRRTYLAGLFMEEMAGNVVEHGFDKDKRSHTVEARVVLRKDDRVILTIKDDCVPFDPEERYRMAGAENEGDVTKNIGIRLVYGIADDIAYQNILGLNVLTIRM